MNLRITKRATPQKRVTARVHLPQRPSITVRRRDEHDGGHRRSELKDSGVDEKVGDLMRVWTVVVGVSRKPRRVGTPPRQVWFRCFPSCAPRTLAEGVFVSVALRFLRSELGVGSRSSGLVVLFIFCY